MAPHLLLGENVNDYVFILQLTSLWVSESETIFYKTYKVATTASMSLYCGCQIAYLLFSVQEYQQLIASLTFLPLFLTCVFKMLIFRHKSDCIKTMVTILKDQQFEPKNEEQATILTKALRLSRMIFVTFISVCFGAIFLLALSPAINEVPSVLFKAWFPLYTLLEDKYGLIFIFQLVNMLYAASNNVVTDSYFAISMVQIGAQCEMLCNSIRNIVSDDIPEMTADQHSQIINAALTICVNHHKQIIKFSRLNLELFNVIVTSQFVASTYVFCLMAVFLTMAVPTDPQYIILTICASAVILEIGLYCWFGNEVTVQSGNLFYEIFQSRWYECSSKLKKNLLIFMMNTRVPIKLHVCNFIPINMATFLSISRSAYAYFTAFKRVLNK